MASPKTPKNDKEAVELLQKADSGTADGREQIETVIEWAESRTNLPEELQLEIAQATTSARLGGLRSANREVAEWATRVQRGAERAIGSVVRGIFGDLIESDAVMGEAERQPSILDRARGIEAEPASTTGGSRPAPSPSQGMSADAAAARAGITAPSSTGASQVEGGVDLGSVGTVIGDPQYLATGPQSGFIGSTHPQARQFRQHMPGREQPYTTGDLKTTLDNMPTEALTRYQEVLVAAGLSPSVIPGEKSDPGTLRGFEELFKIANYNGENWAVTADRLMRSAQSGEIAAAQEADQDPFRFVKSEYLPPDPAKVRNTIRDVAREIVPDVDVSDEEIEYLYEQFEGMGAQQFRAAEQQRMNDARAQYEAEDPTATGDEVITTSEGVQEVSAADRFREFFEDRYSANIERAEDVEQETERRNMTQGNLGRLLQIATGR